MRRRLQINTNIEMAFSFRKAAYGGYFADGARYLYGRVNRRYNNRRTRRGVAKAVRQMAGPVAKAALGTKYGSLVDAAAKYMFPQKRGYVTSAGYSGKIGNKRFKYSRRTKKLARKSNSGVNFNFERTGLYTDNKCVYVSHSTMPLLNIMKYTVYAIFKKVLNQNGIQFAQFTDGRSQRIITGDSFAFSWKPSISAAPVSTGYTVLLSDLTYKQIADGIWNVLNTSLLNSASGFTPQSIMLSFQWYSGVASATIVSDLNLNGCNVAISSKSSLKIQNRSIGSTGNNEEDDVDNVPVHGKGYEGYGNGFIARSSNTIIKPCDLTYGWTGYGAGSEVVLQEPPQVYHFQYARGVKSCHIQPSRIKTSIMYDKRTISLNQLIKTLNAMSIADPDTDQYHRIGKVRMYAFERSIALFGGEVTPGINLACEHDLKCWIDLKIKRPVYTAPDNQVL